VEVVEQEDADSNENLQVAVSTGDLKVTFLKDCKDFYSKKY
jgi:hypothetical protein